MGRLLDAIDQMGVRDNTVFIFTSDNGPEMFEPYYGFSGPWRGTYFTAMEGSLRVPFLMRWPGHIPPGTVSNEIIHEMRSLSHARPNRRGKVPDDRIIDGVDQLDFLTARQLRSNRDSVIIYVGNDLFGVKWRDWKMMMKTFSKGFGEPVSNYSTPLFFDLLIDPKEEHPTDPRVVEDLWARFPITKSLSDHLASLKKEPPIHLALRTLTFRDNLRGNSIPPDRGTPRPKWTRRRSPTPATNHMRRSQPKARTSLKRHAASSLHDCQTVHARGSTTCGGFSNHEWQRTLFGMAFLRALLSTVVALLLLLGGCATRQVNPPMAKYDPGGEYQFGSQLWHQGNQQDLVILAFSGGGTRAAAFSYGVLEGLAAH